MTYVSVASDAIQNSGNSENGTTTTYYCIQFFQSFFSKFFHLKFH